MKNEDFIKAFNFCLENGYRVWVLPFGTTTYKLAILKETKYKWSEISLENKKNYECFGGVVYGKKIGEEIFKTQPKLSDVKWWDKVQELYINIYERIKEKQPEKQRV